MSLLAFLICAAGVVIAIAFSVCEEMDIRRQAAATQHLAAVELTIQEAQAAMGWHYSAYKPGGVVRPRAPEIIAWTPAEREAFGLNELDAWIRKTDQELNKIDWNRRAAAMSTRTEIIQSADGTIVREIEVIDR